jgi:hypothetical protein
MTTVASSLRVALSLLGLIALLASAVTNSRPADAKTPDFWAAHACPSDAVPPAGYADVQGTHAASIDCLTWYGIAEGRSAARYAPAEAVTRGQTATLLMRLRTLIDDLSEPSPVPLPFTDLHGSTHRTNIERMAGLEPVVIAGYEDGTFRPGQAITRAQFASIIARLLDHVAGASVGLEPLPAATGPRFVDVDANGAHSDSIDRLASVGILLGRSDGRFDPGAVIDRAQSATIIARVLGGLADAGLVAEPSPEPPYEPSPEPPAAGRWVPAPGTTWHWQLQGSLDVGLDVQVYNIDGFDTGASTVEALARQGKRTICYISAGSWEQWRPDASLFPASVLGASNGWPGERWLDIRRLDVLGPIMTARMQLCADKGFDAVEPDNIDGFMNATGFELTAADQAVYNRWLARTAHSLGLSIGLKNDVEQAETLEPFFDFAINESCFRWQECESLGVFVAANKAVFHVEYDQPISSFCPQANAMGFSSMRKNLDLGAWSQPCWN